VWRGAYAHSDFESSPDNADMVANGKGNVSLSVMSGHISLYNTHAGRQKAA
jgi:hypothetical protein